MDAKMTADELRRRVEKLGLTRVAVAARLGLTPGGLFKQCHGERKVSRQTELLLECVEQHQVRRVRIKIREPQPDGEFNPAEGYRRYRA
jgi:hypothetical protein